MGLQHHFIVKLGFVKFVSLVGFVARVCILITYSYHSHLFVQQ